jgi:division/cell wall cluster transcriptional repressor MraZ
MDGQREEPKQGGQVQSLLMGRDRTKVDKNGRFVMPKSVREAVGTQVVLMIGAKGCLELTSYLFYEKIWADIDRFSVSSEARRQYASETVGNSYRVVADESGRFVIPQDLCDECDIPRGSDVVVIGVGNAAEVWGEAEFKKYRQDPDGYNRPRRDYIEGLRARMVSEGVGS